MLGIISLSLPAIIDRIARGREMGCRQSQLSLPAWGPLHARELGTFFAETCGRFPDCDFIPQGPRTGRYLDEVFGRPVPLWSF